MFLGRVIIITLSVVNFVFANADGCFWDEYIKTERSEKERASTHLVSNIKVKTQIGEISILTYKLLKLEVDEETWSSYCEYDNGEHYNEIETIRESETRVISSEEIDEAFEVKIIFPSLREYSKTKWQLSGYLLKPNGDLVTDDFLEQKLTPKEVILTITQGEMSDNEHAKLKKILGL